MTFEPYPFERLRALFKDITPLKKGLDLGIGEPRFETPKFIQDTLKEHANSLNIYPKSAFEESLRMAQRSFFKRRFNIELKENELVSTLGSREVLFNFPSFVLFNHKNPTIAYPNPFYQIYEGASKFIKAKSILMPLTKENNFTPSLNEKELEEVNLVILNSPNNPTGRTLSLEELVVWVKLALKYDFILINDECYSEIYEDVPPPSLLEACMLANNKEFKNVLIIHSLSKRSSAPGLRSGFIAGDSHILEKYKAFRTYLGYTSANAIQKASEVAWLDEEHAKIFRNIYANNLKLARKIFKDTLIYPNSFYVYLAVKNGESFAKMLYQNEGITTLPALYLGRNNIGINYVRLALVYDTPLLEKPLEIIETYRENHA
ncbi:succinyldiaminopimelate transaminase [Helicobacter cetorum]|uniref:succinyldiaminopimelate transaminase n=1 Tax=Helicobacter cetorum TaxID=138563 RepID=UPI000CF0874C|nr:succinyldiaminopimelate transaminase [Helicobacter cetorum]